MPSGEYFGDPGTTRTNTVEIAVAFSGFAFGRAFERTCFVDFNTVCGACIQGVDGAAAKADGISVRIAGHDVPERTTALPGFAGLAACALARHRRPRPPAA